MRRFAALTIGVLGCGAEPVASAPEVVVQEVERPAPVYDDRPVRTCALGFAPQRLEVRDVEPLTTAMGKRWLVGRRGEAAVLLHLDAAGKVAEGPLPRYGTVAAVDGERSLRLVWTTEPLEWLRVSLRDRDVPEVGERGALPGLIAGESAKAVAADERVLLVSLMRSEASGETVAETTLLDARTGQRVGAPSPWLVWRAHCVEGRCFGAAEDGAGKLAIVEFSAGGAKALATFEKRECGGMYAWVEGLHWRFAWSRRGSAVTTAVNTQTREVMTTAVPEPPGRERVCASLAPRSAAGEPVVDPDAVVELGEGWMTHMFYAFTPTDDATGEPGKAYYTGHATYRSGEDPEGKHAELFEIPGEDDSIPAGPGSRVLWWTRPGYVGVVFTGGDGGTATYLPLREVCPSVRVPARAPA